MKIAKILAIVVVLLVLVGLWAVGAKKANGPDDVVVDKAVVVGDYVRANIKTLAPNETVLGGSWYVVSINVDEVANTGNVVYEDGHIESEANFNFTVDGSEVEITDFEVVADDNGGVVSTPTPPAEEPVFCTQDAKMCPDGSYVGRVGPSCAFAACPGE